MERIEQARVYLAANEYGRLCAARLEADTRMKLATDGAKALPLIEAARRAGTEQDAAYYRLLDQVRALVKAMP